jgi:hypothetical protein
MRKYRYLAVPIEEGNPFLTNDRKEATDSWHLCYVFDLEENKELREDWVSIAVKGEPMTMSQEMFESASS